MHHQHQYKARRHPSKHLTIIDNAMDQKATSIPRMSRRNNATFNLASLHTHLVDAIHLMEKKTLGCLISNSGHTNQT